jgi:hypothetical protein
MNLKKSQTSSSISFWELGEILLDEDKILGIDYIEIAFPIEGLQHEPEVEWRQGPPPEARYGRWTTWLPLNPEWSKARARMSAHIGSSKRHCVLGFNPSTVLYGPSSGRMASLDGALGLLAAIYEDVVTKQVKTVISLEKCLLTRVDVSMDIGGIDSPERLYRWAQSHPHNSQAEYNYWSKAGRSTGISSLPKSGGLRIYPKRANPPLMRFEAQARKKICEQFCPTVGDLTTTSMRKVFNKYFSRLGESLLKTNDEVISDVLMSDEHQTVIRTCLGESVLIANGYLSHRAFNTQARRQLQKQGVLDQIDHWVAQHWS